MSDSSFDKQHDQSLTHNSDLDGLPRSLKASLTRAMASFQEKKRVEAESLATQGYDPDTVFELEQEALGSKNSTPSRRSSRGRTSESVVEQAQLHLFEMERHGRFVALPIHPSNEFPTLLTRIPIFVPGRRSNQRKYLDSENAVPFETSWGKGRKHGPPLTIYDEDTLMALGRLRQNMLIGEPSKMPFKVAQFYARREDPEVHVHVVYCLLSDIQNICGTSLGGKNNKLRLASVKRLAATILEFNQATKDKIKTSGTSIKLIDVLWEDYEDNAVLFIQFTPIMAAWLEDAFTFIDWNIRRKIRTDTGKAVHRFLSGQGRVYAIRTLKLKETIGHPGAYKYFMVDLRETLEMLQKEGWLNTYEIQGNGRKQPHKLTIKRT